MVQYRHSQVPAPTVIASADDSALAAAVRRPTPFELTFWGGPSPLSRFHRQRVDLAPPLFFPYLLVLARDNLALDLYIFFQEKKSSWCSTTGIDP